MNNSPIDIKRKRLKKEIETARFKLSQNISGYLPEQTVNSTKNLIPSTVALFTNDPKRTAELTNSIATLLFNKNSSIDYITSGITIWNTLTNSKTTNINI